MAYQLVHRLGRGGMGVVDLATGPDGRPVAIKRLFLHGSAREMSQARARIRREGEALRQLDHPHIVRLLDVHDDGDDVVLVMPFLEGGTLSDRVRAGGPLGEDEVRRIGPALLGALAAAHRAGIVHRDIKPANVLFDADGRPFLADFGIASLHDATAGLTLTGMTMGTPEFMAPEQARGERATPASDVFSLGATLAYAATGTPPYGRGDPQVLLQRAAKAQIAPLPRTLPRDLRHALEPLLDRNPRRRPTAAAAVGGPAGTVVAARGAPRPTRRRTAMFVAGGALMAGMILGAAALTITNRGFVDHSATPTAAAPTTAPPTTRCVALAYRPCGQPVAAHTDGNACIDGHADDDGDARNGCEAAPDTVDGTRFDGPITANLVPGTDSDQYPFHVDDAFQLLCDGVLRVTLTAPATTTMRLDILRGDTVIGTTTSSDGNAATMVLSEPSCFQNDSTDLAARVSSRGDHRSGAPYRLERSGSY